MDGKDMTIALVVLGGVISAGLLVSIIAAVVQGRDPASIAIATVPVLLAAVAALMKQRPAENDPDKKDEGGADA